MKRGRESLTGGTGDVNPQFLSGSVTMSASNVGTNAQVILPIQRLPETSGRAIVMEVLKVFVDIPINTVTNAAATVYDYWLWFATYNPGAVDPTWADPRVFAMIEADQYYAFTAAGTGLLSMRNNPYVLDLTDGDGHGVLVATDSIYVRANTTNNNAAQTFSWKILYRWKKVSLAEYIGIVQSQQ